MNIADYQGKVYDTPNPCWHLVADVLVNECGLTVDGVLEFHTISSSIREVAQAFRLALHKDRHGFGRVAEPSDFAIVLMGETLKLGVHHCGIYYEGSVLHAEPNATYYQDLASLRDRYEVLEFWSRA